METLRFLMVSSHYPPSHLGGDAVMVRYLSEALSKQGHEVHVLHNPSVYKVVRGGEIRAGDSTESLAPSLHSSSSAGTLRVLASLAFDTSGKARTEVVNLAHEAKVDVVHWHNTKGFVGRPFSIPGTLSVYTAHDYYLVCPRSNLMKPDMSFCTQPRLCQFCLVRWRKPPEIWRTGHRRVIKLPKEMGVISPSRFLSARLKRDGIDVRAVLRNFVPDPGDVGTTPSDTQDLITFTGMIEPHKGPMTLLEAFAKCRDKQGFKLKIIGEGSQRPQLQARIEELGLADRVNAPGFVTDAELRSIRGRSAAVVVPSEWPENAPLVVLESLAMGVPVIASDAGGLPEILNQDSGSEVFKQGDVESLSECLVSRWQERDNLAELRKKARLAYLERFSPSAHVSEYLEIVRGSHSDASAGLVTSSSMNISI